MGGISQESPNKGRVLNFNKRHYRQSLNNKFWNTRLKIYGFEYLENINSESFREIKLLAENPLVGEKFSISQNLKVL